jgi:glutamine synthetase
MSVTRFNAIETVLKREENHPLAPSTRIPDYFGSNVFGDEAMRKFMSDKTYKMVKAAINHGTKIDATIADQVAAAMRSWACEKGATHYSHWFQPLTGTTAEKHDSFFSLSPDGNVIEEFKGGALVQQEPDASSFPNGGIRSTFEARGYTAWDPSSPAFIMDSGHNKTLCIPTIFIAYTGESLDYKAPLLKAQHFLDKAATAVCQYFDKNVTKVNTTLGWEQEYFLVDEAFVTARQDLLLTGRTLLSRVPPKGQQLDDHYFGSIPERVMQYMYDLEIECHKLGIPVRTRHNEVAPGQYELAPMFEEVNVAVDHNQLLMDVMDKVARRHRLRVLLHEKPFAGVNGSGKHNNWSMSTNTGINLLAPSDTPRKNIQFLTFFVNTIKAVHDHADLLRATVASASNDHRLGANEAPPAIISTFIGDTLSKILDELEIKDEKEFLDEHTKQDVKLDIHNKIPDLMLDNTDRNRTSPFAFTGNKFEIRMCGSQQNCASPMTVMNTIVGAQLLKFKEEVDTLIKTGMKKDSAIFCILKQMIKDSKNIRFEGDGYSDEWKEEAARRGLGNMPNTPDALDAFVSKASLELFAKANIMSHIESEARYEIALHDYVKKLQIEGRVMGDMCNLQIMPAALKYLNVLLENTKYLHKLGLEPEEYAEQTKMIKAINGHINGMRKNVVEMTLARKHANEIEDLRQQAAAYCDNVKGNYFDIIREHADKLEELVDDAIWPLPKYREMLFIR